MPPTGLPEIHQLTDLAAAYDLSPDTLYDLARSGELVAFKIGRRWWVRGEDWSAFLARRAGAAS